jgi:hypothetical protein
VVSAAHGNVMIEQPHHRHFVRVSRPVMLKVGGIVDTAHGTALVRVQTHRRHGHGNYASAKLAKGQAQVFQGHSAKTTLKLSGAISCSAKALDARAKRAPRSRRLWVGDVKQGSFVSKGRYLAAAASNSTWTTSDYCGKTVVHVQHGKVTATVLATGAQQVVTAGRSLTVTAPPASPKADFAWTAPTPISTGAGLTAVSCAPGGLCGAVDTNGDFVSSSNPAGGAGTWTTVAIDPGASTGLVGISCPTAQFCAAISALPGDVLVSTDPAGGAAGWKATELPGGGVPQAIDCPTSTLCVIVDSTGDVITSTDPTGGASAWSSASVNPGNSLDGVGCAGTALCVAAGAGLSTSTMPAGGASAWRTTTAVSGGAVSCPTSTLCVIGGGTGDAEISTDPTGGPSAYTDTYIDTIHVLETNTGVSCVAGGPCVVVGDGGDAITSLDPAGGAKAWTTVNIDPSAGLSAVSCASADLCVAVDTAGDALVGRRSG